MKPASADCNLNCTYCFYLPKASIYPESTVHRMSDEVLERLIQTYMATEQPVHSFGWQGGEPTLMGVEFFRKVTELQKKYGQAGARVANGLQTNATLVTDEFAEHLAAYQFLVGVSVDGPVELHDRYRLTRGGAGSHQRVMDAIDRLREHQVDVNALVLVSQANVRHASDVYHYLKSKGLLFHQYIPCVEFLPSGEPAPFAISGEEWGGFLTEIFELWNPDDVRTVSIRHLDALMGFFLDGSSQMCTMGGHCDAYYVVEHNGDIYPCDFYVDDGLCVGNIVTGDWPALARSPIRRQFSAKKTDWAPSCDGCVHVPYCSGDCIKHRDNRAADEGSWLCGGWKRFYDAAVPTLRRLAETVSRERGLHGPLWDPSTWDPESPCYCGSGKKAKNCHGRLPSQESTAAATSSRSTSSAI